MSSDLRQPGEATPATGDPDRSGELRRVPWITVALVLLMFAAYGTWRAPVPGVNEPHYLGKARHFWDPGWCARDVFLQSSNPHWVFYATVGVLTKFCTFEQAAWVGRGLAWGALAIGWVALARSIAPGRWMAIRSALLFLGMSATGNLSGEWIIGGVESKVFAYAAIFLALAAAGRNRLLHAGAWSGVAVSFHPVVGIWSVAALVFALVIEGLLPQRADDADDGPVAPFGFRWVAIRFVGPALICGLLSLPGLIPSLPLLFAGIPREVVQEADDFQVFDRLGHHLDPHQFAVRAWRMYAVLLIVWLLSRPWRDRSATGRVFFGFVSGTLLIAGAGAAIGFGPAWPGVLKFYPFRVADAFLPIAVALALASRFRWPEDVAGRPIVFRGVRLDLWIGLVLFFAAGSALVSAPGDDRNPTGWSVNQRADWIDVCRWVDGNTPAEVLCLTPRYANYTFKWYAGRAEYAIWKDCPQDAVSLLEWKRRLDLVRTWRGKYFESGYTAEALDDLHRETGCDYVVDWWNQPYRVEPVYRNRSFRVYRLGGRGAGDGAT